VCPDQVIDPAVDANSSLCAQYYDCLNRCGGLNVACNNCCTPAMNLPCMLCVQGLLGCAMQNGCARGLNFDLACVAQNCNAQFWACFVDEVQ